MAGDYAITPVDKHNVRPKSGSEGNGTVSSTVRRMTVPWCRRGVEPVHHEGLVDKFTELVLANAVALAAPWKDRFDVESTQTGEFKLPDGSVTDVQMMGREYQYPFALDFELAGDVRRACVHRGNTGSAAMLLGEYETAERLLRASLEEASGICIAQACGAG